MRALWLVRRNLEQHPGGDTTQILSTAAALRQQGVEVTLAERPPRGADGFDVLHLWHLDRLWEHLPVCRVIRRHRTPAVLSTIYWPADEFDHAARRGLQGRLARALGSDAYRSLRVMQRAVLAAVDHASPASLLANRGLLRGFRAAARELLASFRVILPNSAAEVDVLRSAFGSLPPVQIVPNAVDVDAFAPPSEPSQRAGVLCVGRIEPRKNQLTLLRAFDAFDTPELSDVEPALTLVGGAGRFSGDYWRACRAAAGPRVRFVEHSTGAALRDLYHRAAVHVNVSWYETPGLASLEAAASGCRIVATPGGATREYLGDAAFWCQPNDVESIRAAIAQALAAGIDDSGMAYLSDCVRKRYTWSAAAVATLRGYELALQGAT